MRTCILIPLAVLLVAAAGLGLCLGLGVAPHWREMLVAALGCVVVAELALMPLLLNHRAPHATLAMAALVGTGVHLLGSAILAAAALFSGRVEPWAFAGWLFAFYWTTLLVLVFSLARTLRQAPVASPAAKQG